MYQRVYVKFLDTVNKREYVRVCSRKPRCKPMNSLRWAKSIDCHSFSNIWNFSDVAVFLLSSRGVQVKTLLGLTAAPSSASQSQKPRPKQVRSRAEQPPKKRRKWKEEFSPTGSGSSAEEGGEDDGEEAFWLFSLSLVWKSVFIDHGLNISLLSPYFLMPSRTNTTLRFKSPGAICFTVSQHTNNEGDIQELCGTARQHCPRRRCDDSTWESKRWVK